MAVGDYVKSFTPDTLELRHGPTRDALAAAEPVMRAIGDAMGPAPQIVLVPGNHDHALAAGWLDWRGRRQQPDPIGLEERIAAERGSWIAKRLAGWLGPTPVEIAYPGLWLRDDVYACHGHYLDAHVAYRRACLNAIEYLKKFGYTGEQAYVILGTAPVEGRVSGIVDIPNACCTVAIPTDQAPIARTIIDRDLTLLAAFDAQIAEAD